MEHVSNLNQVNTLSQANRVNQANILNQANTLNHANTVNQAKDLNHARTPLSDNVFTRRIFDKETGGALVCRFHEGQEPQQTFGLNWWSSNTISYDTVMELAVNALHAEQGSALHALEMLGSREAAQEQANRMEELSSQARAVFDEMAELEALDLRQYQLKEQGSISEEAYQEERARLDQKLLEKDQVFSEFTEQATQMKKAFSRRNPWIKLYSSIEIPEVLTKEQVKKWIGRITVEDMAAVELSIPKAYAWWKEQLPAEWMG